MDPLQSTLQAKHFHAATVGAGMNQDPQARQRSKPIQIKTTTRHHSMAAKMAQIQNVDDKEDEERNYREGQAGYLPLKPVSGCGAESIQELRPGLEPVQATATRVTVDQLPSLVLSTVFL